MRPNRRIILPAVALLLCGVGLWLAPRMSRGPRLLSDVGPPIAQAVCSVNSARRAALRNASLVTNIVNGLPARAHVLLVMNDPESLTVAANPWPDRIDLLSLSEEVDITIWPQDPFLVLCDPQGETSLLTSRSFDRADDRAIAAAIAERLGYACEASALGFEGGNIVSDRQFAFIGGNTIRFNAVEMNQSESHVRRRFERELGRPVIVVGPVPQPIAHLDMFLTPLGERRVALADPAWGARLAEQQLNERPEAVAQFEQHLEQMYFGHPAIRRLRDREGHAIEPPDVAGATALAVDESRDVAERLDELAEHLTRQRFKVIRIPYLARRETSGTDGRATRGATDAGDTDTKRPNDSQTPGPGYPQLTYNNVLLESAAGERTVYLPQYGWEALDAAAREAWQAAGWRVVPVHGLEISAMYGGSLRCCVKVLERTAEPRETR